ETALLNDMIDIAVHSMKDLETKLPDGLSIAAVLPREDVRDAFISRKFKQLTEMPTGAVVGTSSLRRRAQVLSNRPDLKIVDFRGNVQTRLKKLDAGIADATFLACAGLRRLGYSELLTSPIDPAEMLPAVAQGAIALQIRANDRHCASLVSPLSDTSAEVRTAVERAFLAELDGSCRTPIAGLAVLDEDQIWFTGQILRPDGSETYTAERRGTSKVACQLGVEVARELMNKAGQHFFGKA
ncbi:MAG: hydroxymethylbilane synthase, partial [Hyphomicrobiaceae bacterium]